MVDASSPDFRQVPIVRLTEPECPIAKLLAIQEFPTFAVAQQCGDRHLTVLALWQLGHGVRSEWGQSRMAFT
jgi:hypothetical protein